MSSLCRPGTFFLLLLLLGTKENLAREIAIGGANNIETAYASERRDDAHLCLNHGNDHDEHMHAHTSSSSSPPPPPSSSSSSSHMDDMNLSVNLFLHFENLNIGEKFPLYFPIQDPSKIPHFIPREEANSIPFSLSQLPQILEYFTFPEDSPQAKAMEDSLRSCELPPIRGERKFCATSLESMLDFVRRFFGSGADLKVLTSTHLKNRTVHLQNYSVVEDPKEISTTHMVGCHPLPYPYALFYCHGQEETHNKLFLVSLQGQDDGVRIEAVVICHMDTSQWEPRHPSFRVLGIEPGTSPVCHVLPQDSLVWVSPPSSLERVY